MFTNGSKTNFPHKKSFQLEKDREGSLQKVRKRVCESVDLKKRAVEARNIRVHFFETVPASMENLQLADIENLGPANAKRCKFISLQLANIPFVSHKEFL
jgi:hypothetical protein